MMRLVALVSLLAAHSASAFVLPATKVVGAPAKASAMRSFAVRVSACVECARCLLSAAGATCSCKRAPLVAGLCCYGTSASPPARGQ